MEQVQTTELIRTNQSWDGVELPDYLIGKPKQLVFELFWLIFNIIFGQTNPFSYLCG